MTENETLRKHLEDCVASLEALKRFAPALLDAAGADPDDEEWIGIASRRAVLARQYLDLTKKVDEIVGQNSKTD